LLDRRSKSKRVNPESRNRANIQDLITQKAEDTIDSTDPHIRSREKGRDVRPADLDHKGDTKLEDEGKDEAKRRPKLEPRERTDVKSKSRLEPEHKEADHYRRNMTGEIPVHTLSVHRGLSGRKRASSE
jgi:hypothetical protein